MKTLQIGLGWFPENTGGGGLDRVYYDCIHHLPQAGVALRGLVIGSDRVPLESQGQVQAFAPREVGLWQRCQGARQAVHKALAEEDFSLVVSHFALYTLPALNQLTKYPTVMHFQGPWAQESLVEGQGTLATRIKWCVEWLVYRRISHFIVLSQAFRQLLHQTYHVPLDRIHIVPPGLDIERFTPTCTRIEARAKLGWTADGPQIGAANRPTIFVIRRLVKRMGIENLVAAMAQVKQQHPDVLLLIAGKGPLTATLQAQIEALGLADNVKLLGFVPDDQLALAYRAADFSIVPTVALEGFGLVTIESLAAGTPVLGTPVDSLPEILTPLSPDLVLEGSSAEHLAKGIIEVLSGQRQLPDQATCEAYVRAHYTWPVVAEQIKAVYQLALEG
jgi:glycosyltransferase involved in cell wall biosynthesis